jgi:hypothetical protein
MLHANELPLRHLVAGIDGKTSGSRGFTGPIGKQLSTCENLPVVKFASIAGNLEPVDVSDLSSDQRYLYEMYISISEGKVSDAMANRSPGNMNHARWLTTGNRVLRLYVASETPSENLVSLTRFIMDVYVPMWFCIKCNPFVQDGAKHVFRTLQAMKKQNRRIQSIVMPVIQRNAYFSHPENILLSMIGGLAWRRIKKTRCDTSVERTHNVRKFSIPKLNFDCNDYVDLIHWPKVTLTEPPLTMNLSNDIIDRNIKDKTLFMAERFPLHTQAVERIIKLVSEADLEVCSHESYREIGRASCRERV